MARVIDDKLAALEIESAELRRRLDQSAAELAEARAQQQAVAEVLRVINSSPGDIAPVLDAILEKATTLCEAAFGTLATYDGERFDPGAAFGVPPEFADFRRGRGAFLPTPGSSLERVANGEDLVHIADVATDPGQSATALVQLGRCRTLVCVALRREQQLIGAITAYRQEVRPFTGKQIALLQDFAAQAVIAIENARLLTETREALQQQTATAEVLQVINSSPGDLAPVFDAMLEKAMRLCEASFGNFMSYDGEFFRFVAARGHPRFDEWTRRLGPYRAFPGSTNERLLNGEAVAQATDLRNSEAYRLGDPGRRAQVEIGGFRTLLSIALRKDATLLGTLHLHRQEARPFSDKQIALLQNFAAQAVIAMENARLLGELRQRTSDLEASLAYQTATSDVLQAISRSTFDLEPVLDTLLATAARLCNAEAGHITRREGEIYRVASTFALTPDWDAVVRQVEMRPGDGSLVGRTALARHAVHIDDIAAEPDHPNPAVVTLGKLRTGLGVPLLREGEPIGVISLARQRVEPFTERQIELVRTFADQAVIAMENARLLGELRSRTEEIAALNRDLEARVAAQLGELERMGKLKRFLAPQLAEMIVARGEERILESHRRDIVVVFCDLRGFTAFAETAEPEEVLDLMREYHAALGPIVTSFEGTLDHFSGDGIMVLFNDPLPCPDAPQRAVAMACAMRGGVARLQAQWRRRGRRIGFGVGIAQGYATLGEIGFAERVDYTAIGTVCNLAARLCGAAEDGQILVSARVAAAVEDGIRLAEVGDLPLKGLSQEVAVYNVA